jgi:hypothetical protein
VKATALYVLSAAAMIAVAGALLALGFGPGARPVLVTTGLVALAVQVVAFLVARALAARHLWVAWGAGSLLRLVALVAYAFLAVKVLALPMVPAVLGMAVFLFVTTLIEPLLLRL